MFRKGRKKEESIQEQARKVRRLLDEAEAVLIGAGAGLSAAAGFTYSGERFVRYFSDFGEKYHFEDMYSGGFYPFPAQEEFWAFWSRNILINRYMDPPRPVYRELLELVREKDYFVLTTNVDHCFQKAGFDKKRLFYTQGDYGLFQCAAPCHAETYDNETAVREMYQRQSDMRIPTELLPICPRCGGPMMPNLRCDDRFVEDAGWHEAADRFREFVETRQEKRLLLLELGVGYNTPVIIRIPFEQMAASFPYAALVRVNRNEADLPDNLQENGVSIAGDIGEVVAAVLRQTGT